ncbi:MAG: hypothetical protein IPM98_15180 [Lewinellaceae bacterium]|nr:hypothetical protein [Lewinellaceae bacterium]
MNTNLESIIILDIILDRASGTQIAQLCSGLSDSWYSQAAQANTPYTFNWGTGGVFPEIKIVVGDAEFLAEYDTASQEVKIIGTCGSTDWDNFNINNQTLYYSDSVVAFEIQFHLLGGTTLEISVISNSNTTIEAFF